MSLNKKIILKDIPSASWEHPADKLALEALRKVPGLDMAIKAQHKFTVDKRWHLWAMANYVHVSEKQYPDLYKKFQLCCEILDVPKQPELFIGQNPFANAFAVGVDDYMVVLNSSLLQLLKDDDEILGIMGHELGHIVSGHAVYKTLLNYLMNMSQFLLKLPLGGKAIMTLLYSLREWDRKSELSADRAALLCAQNPEAYYSCLMKLAGGMSADELNFEAFLEQARYYKQSSGLMDNFYKVVDLNAQSHPFPVLRLLECYDWVNSGSYDRILSGNYSAADEDLSYTYKTVKDKYTKDFNQVIKPVEDAVGGATKKAKDMFDTFATIFKKNDNDR